MYFEIIGPITAIEVIAAGRRSVSARDCTGSMVVEAGVNSRASRRYALPAVTGGAPRFIATRRMESAVFVTR
jgi:hypothetical protein